VDRDDLVKRLMVTFVGELDDHARALERDLLALEKKPAPEVRGELFASLFRTAHSLKGSARTVRLNLLETTGHHLEEVFAARAQPDGVPVDAGFFESAAGDVDAIGEAGHRLRTNSDLAGRTARGGDTRSGNGDAGTRGGPAFGVGRGRRRCPACGAGMERRSCGCRREA